MRSSKRKSEPDIVQLAAQIVRQATGTQISPLSSATPEGKNPAAVQLGRLGGLKGGKARAAKLTAKQRREIAQKAAQARWTKKH